MSGSTAGCAWCSASVADARGPNYVDHCGYAWLLCAECWDDADGLVCDECDQLSEAPSFPDTWEWTRGTPWPWGSRQVVCDDCAERLLMEGWAALGLSQEACATALTLWPEWNGTDADLAHAARMLTEEVKV